MEKFQSGGETEQQFYTSNILYVKLFKYLILLLLYIAGLAHILLSSGTGTLPVFLQEYSLACLCQ